MGMTDSKIVYGFIGVGGEALLWTASPSTSFSSFRSLVVPLRFVYLFLRRSTYPRTVVCHVPWSAVGRAGMSLCVACVVALLVSVFSPRFSVVLVVGGLL
jgi:hypothetical protein